MQYLCPNDGTVLEHSSEHGGPALVCPYCRGEMINVAVLKRDPTLRASVQAIWDKARASGSANGRDCPQCQSPMKQGVIPGRIDKLDVCTVCQTIWFDRGEVSLLPRSEPVVDVEAKPAAASELDDFSPEARAAFAQLERAGQRMKGRRSSTSDENEIYGIKRWIAMLWIPVREVGIDLAETPLITLGAIALMVIGFFLTYHGGGSASAHPGAQLDALIQSPFRTVLAGQHWGFRVGEPFRIGGLTLLTSFFIQINFITLVYCVAFLKVFGEEVEDELGKLGYALLIVAGHLAGLMAFVLMAGSPARFIVGANSAITAVYVFHLFIFRDEHFIITFWWPFRWYYFRSKGYLYLVPWLIILFLAPLMQISYARDASVLMSPIGGAAVGAVWAWFYRRKYA